MKTILPATRTQLPGTSEPEGQSPAKTNIILPLSGNGPLSYEPQDEGHFSLSEKVREKVEEPPKYVVYLLNDDYSTFDFVVHVLVNIFRKSIEEAIRITNDVHHRGKGACGMYTKQIAETKVMLVEEASSSAGYPLRAVMEEA
ncbi:ATP-dependent Clp protease adaptor ClpS [Cyclonatronum sp.]|uniref:ATP-dependent Clp protease adaptor ClpS n=1 Tax=Cyclonatronum sp. TaxID=3024185 RepID=UPI0025BFA995|nr:ATP-dependent Clp protease adaptor ClpS [Cyclonatronum sp.]